MKYYCYLTLRPTYWSQTLQHYGRIGVEGRRLFANCAVESGSDLDLSNGMKLDALPTYLSIYEPAQMQDELAKMPEGALGLFSFREGHEAEDDQPAQDPFLSGWLVLNAQSLQDTWDQVLHGDYTDCTIQIAISPVESSGGNWRWDVKRTPHLEIDTVEVSFTRKAARPEVQAEARSFWKR
jgi:hypothetical protein